MPSNTPEWHLERSPEEAKGQKEEGIHQASQPEGPENKSDGWQGELRRWSQQPRVEFKLEPCLHYPSPQASVSSFVKWRPCYYQEDLI